MNTSRASIVWLLATMILIVGFSCAQEEQVAPEPEEQEPAVVEETSDIPREELFGTIPEIDDLHEAVYPLWHTAYPQKDYDGIKELLPQLDSLTAKLGEASFPRILHMYRETWDKGMENLNAALQKLHEAVDADDKAAILAQTEAFHTSFEALPHTISPGVPELEAFHRELYKIVHYYMADGDLDKIRETVAAMQEILPSLMQAELPEHLAARSEDFAATVKEIESALTSFAEASSQDDMPAIEAASKGLHGAFLNANKLTY